MSEAPESGAPSNEPSTGVTPPEGQSNQQPPSSDTDDFKAKLAAAETEVEKWKVLARKHEDRAKSNAEAASKAKTVEEQLEEMRKTIAERDIADVQRAGREAMTQVRANLAGAGFNQADVAELLEFVEPGILLKEGNPDESKIKKLTESLIKTGGRSTPDPDQGKGGGKSADKLDMNSLIRRRAGVSK